jgi:hypothetical protein
MDGFILALLNAPQIKSVDSKRVHGNSMRRIEIRTAIDRFPHLDLGSMEPQMGDILVGNTYSKVERHNWMVFLFEVAGKNESGQTVQLEGHY